MVVSDALGARPAVRAPHHPGRARRGLARDRPRLRRHRGLRPPGDLTGGGGDIEVVELGADEVAPHESATARCCADRRLARRRVRRSDGGADARRRARSPSSGVRARWRWSTPTRRLIGATFERLGGGAGAAARPGPPPAHRRTGALRGRRPDSRLRDLLPSPGSTSRAPPSSGPPPRAVAARRAPTPVGLPGLGHLRRRWRPSACSAPAPTSDVDAPSHGGARGPRRTPTPSRPVAEQIVGGAPRAEPARDARRAARRRPSRGPGQAAHVGFLRSPLAELGGDTVAQEAALGLRPVRTAQTPPPCSTPSLVRRPTAATPAEALALLRAAHVPAGRPRPRAAPASRATRARAGSGATTRAGAARAASTSSATSTSTATTSSRRGSLAARQGRDVPAAPAAARPKLLAVATASAGLARPTTPPRR